MTALGTIPNTTDLASSHISDFTEALQDAIGSGDHTTSGFLRQGSNVTLTYDDVAGTLTIGATPGGGGGTSYFDQYTGIGSTSTVTLALSASGPNTNLIATIPATAPIQAAQLGIGVPASAGQLAYGTGGSADTALARSGAGTLDLSGVGAATTAVLRLATPSTGQNASYQLLDGTTPRWQLLKTSANDFIIRDASAGKNLITVSGSTTAGASCVTWSEKGPDPVAGNLGTATFLDATLVFNQSFDMGGGVLGTGGGKKWTRFRVYRDVGATPAEFVNGTSGSTGIDDVTALATLSSDYSSYSDVRLIHSMKTRGSLVPVYVTAQSIEKPVGMTYPNTYNEYNGMASYIEAVKNKGCYAGCWEGSLTIQNVGQHADAGPIRGFGSLMVFSEGNAYATYATGFPAGTGWSYTGSRGIWLESHGAQPLGTGIHMRGSAGFYRMISCSSVADGEIFCVDGNGNVGIRKSTNQTFTLAYALTVGYDQFQAASTAVADGIGFGGDVTLHRAAAGRLTVTGAFAVTGNVGFYNTAPVAKPTVTGSKGSNAALTSLMTALASLGLVTNSTT